MFPKQLLAIRFLQIFRALVKIPLHAFIILGSLAFISRLTFGLSSQFKNSLFIAIGILLITATIQYHRNDKRFIFKNLAYPNWQIYLEYSFFSSFLMVGSLFTAHWYIFILVHIGLMLLSRWQTHSHYKTPLKNLSKWIPSFNFEIISGLRKSFYIVWPAYLLAYIFCWVKILPLFILWFINIHMVGYFNENESLQMITANSESRWKFIRRKILKNLLFITITYAPIIALQCYNFPEMYYMSIAFLLVQYLLLIFSIVNKYALYEPSAPPTNNSILLAIVSMVALVPYSLPLLLLVDIWFVIRAHKNLKTYLS